MKLEVQTAGGGREAEASLSATTKDQALELQEQLRINNIGEVLLENQISPFKYRKKSWEQKAFFIAATTSNGIGVVFSRRTCPHITNKSIFPRRRPFHQIGKIYYQLCR